MMRELNRIVLGEERWWMFRIVGDEAEFRHELAALKARVPVQDRHWDPETKLWAVAERAAPALEEVFPEFRGLREEIESQLELM